MLDAVGQAHIIADRFDVLGLAGAGGSACVYRATDRHSGQTVAVKVLRGTPNAEDVERFAREAALLAQLSHPGVVRYLTHGREDDGLFLAMEWLEGMTLSQRIAKEALTIDESLTLVRGVAEALGSAHARGIVHRDVKPGNIFLVDGDPARVRLLDFGIARLRTASTELTRTGMVIGTPGYMAPEQARGLRDIDARADVFSLGCVLFRCITGRAAFAGADIVAVLTKVLLDDAPLARSIRPDVPPAIESLLSEMLAKSPADRPKDANAVLEALHRVGASTAPELPTMRMGSSLTTDERRMMCILFSRAPHDAPADVALTATNTLRAAIAAQGGHLDVLADRSMLVTLEGRNTPTDSAARAARCALAIRSVLPDLPVVVVAGEAEMKGNLAMGPVIDRGAALLHAVESHGAVRIDEVIAGFLDGRFDVRVENGAIALLGERATPSMARTFLGRPSTCVGRERDLALLEGVFDECIEESVARLVLVTGPAGIGKSRLVDELLRKVGGDPRPLEVWRGRGDAMSARAPFGMIADPIRAAAGVRPGDTPAERREKLRARVASSVAPEDVQRVTEFLAEVIGAPVLEGESVALAAARRDPLLMGDQMRRAWEDWLDAETLRHPVLLLLEDLHFGDVSSVQFVDAAARHLAGRAFMVLALARPDIYDWFPNIWTERNLTELRLRRLTDKAATKLVRDALGPDADERDVARIVEQGEGNAFFLEELVRAAVDGKGNALPTTVLAMVQARLGGLSVEARRFLRAASIFGKGFSTEGVFALIGTDDPPSIRHEWLAELVAKDVIQRPPDARIGGELAFHHALLHEAAYSMLTEADRALGHRLAGHWLENTGQADPAVLAEHFEKGGERERAMRWYWRAAEQALGGNDHRAAIEYAEKALGSGAREEEEGALRLIESEARRWRGDNEESRTAALLAMQLLPRGSAGWCKAASELAAASGSLGDTEHLVHLAEELIGVAPVGDGSELVHALARLARPLFWAGKHALASRTLLRAGALTAEEARIQPTALAALYMARGVEARLGGDPSGCVRCNERAVRESERAGDLRGGCVERGNLGYAYLEMGAHAEAEEALVAALATAARLGLPLVMATAQQNLGLALCRRGTYDQAARLEQSSFVTFEAQHDRRRAGCSLLYAALIEVARGDLPQAQGAAQRALTTLAEHEPLRCHGLAVLAEIELALGDDARGIENAREAYAVFSRLGGIDEGESRVRLVRALGLAAARNGEAAKSAIAEALERLLARAANIPDPNRRGAFLDAIPENARTLSLAREWGVPVVLPQ